MKLWIGNIAPGTSDEDVKAFIAKYAPAFTCTGITRVDGSGSRPAAILEFAEVPLAALETISMRLNGMYWKERELLVQVMTR